MKKLAFIPFTFLLSLAFSLVLSGCASFNTREPSSDAAAAHQGLVCPMAQPLSENETKQTPVALFDRLRAKGYAIANRASVPQTQATYMTSLQEGESGIITTFGTDLDPSYVHVVMLKKVHGQVQIVKILTSSSGGTVDDLFQQLPPCS